MTQIWLLERHRYVSSDGRGVKVTEGMGKDFESPFISQHVSQLISSNLVMVYIEFDRGLSWVG